MASIIQLLVLTGILAIAAWYTQEPTKRILNIATAVLALLLVADILSLLLTGSALLRIS